MLEASWNRCWNALNAEGDGSSLRQQLLSAYAEPQRHYHTLQHLSECLSLFARHRHLALDPAAVEMALWFHDAIYDVTASDNELKSAAWAGAELEPAGVADSRIARIRQLILATRHAALPEGQDPGLLVDIDLAILGAPPARFAEYEAQIRMEYSWVPEALFCQKRAEILAGFLARQPLFGTPELREALELPARSNLADALARLGGLPGAVYPAGDS